MATKVTKSKTGKPVRSTSGRVTKAGSQLSVKLKGAEHVKLIQAACELIGATVEEFVMGVTVASARLVLQNGGIPEEIQEEIRGGEK